MVLLLDFTHSWNDSWVEKDEQKWSVQVLLAAFPKIPFCAPNSCLVSDQLILDRYIALLVVSIGCYLAAFTFSGLLFIWFNPSGHDCGLNVFFLVMTMILAFVFAVIALHPAVRITLCYCFIVHIRHNFLLYQLSYIHSSAVPVLRFMNSSCVIELKFCTSVQLVHAPLTEDKMPIDKDGKCLRKTFSLVISYKHEIESQLVSV